MEEGQVLAEDPAQIASVTLEQTVRESADFHTSVGLKRAALKIFLKVPALRWSPLSKATLFCYRSGNEGLKTA